MKWRVRLLLCLSLSGLMACEPSPPAAQTEAPKRVLLVMKSLVNPYYQAIEQGARRAAQEQGLELVVRSGTNETLVEQQAEIIAEQLDNNIAAIVIAPADSVKIIPILRKAAERNIQLVNIDNKIDEQGLARAGLPDIPYVSVDNEQGGYLAANYLALQLDAPAQAVILEGPREAKNARERRDGALRAFASSKHQIDVVASEEANWRIEQAYGVLKQMHRQHPEIKLVFAANDMMALGASLYLQENPQAQMLIAGYDNIGDVQQAIKDGFVQASVDQQAEQQGYFGVLTAAKLLASEPVEPVVLVDVKLITTKEL